VSAEDDAALELVLGKLDGVTPRGGYWMARCPAHEDRKASLKVMRGTEQPVVLKCYAECATVDVLAAIGLTMADVSRPQDDGRAGEWTPHGPAIEVYDYTDEGGKLLFQVCRTADKEFPQRVPDATAKSGWRWKLGRTRRVLYRLPKVIEAVAAGEFIYVAEGERDVHALEAAGVTATTNPGGAGKWRPEFAEFLRGAVVTVIADKDESEAGLRHARQIIASLEGIAAATEILQAAEGKDARDHLAAGLTVADLVRLPETDTSDSGEEEVSEKTSALTCGNDTSDSSDGGAGYELRDGAWLDSQKFPPLKYTVPGLMPAGLGIIAAPPKAGKSLLILDWLLAVASGGHALGALPVGPARDVVYFALEDGDRRLQARCRHLLAPGEPIPARFRHILAVPPGQVLAVLDDVLGRHPDTALIVIDTLGRIMPLPMQGETTYQRDYRVAVALKRIADDHPGLTIIVIHHTRKALSADFVDSISGTHGLAGAADTIITLSRGRGQGAGVLQVTGRDVVEADYAVNFSDGVWMLDGSDLAEARANVSRRADAAALSGRSAEIIDFVRQHPDGATTKQVTDKFGKDASQYLMRHAKAGRLAKPRRGLYVVTPSELSEESEPQVSGLEKTDTDLLPLSEVSETGRVLARRDPSVPDPRPPCNADDPDHEACWDALAGRCLLDGA
jgi:hypothetical protein